MHFQTGGLGSFSHEFCRIMSLGCGYLYCYNFFAQYKSCGNHWLLMGGEGDQSLCRARVLSLIPGLLSLHPFGASVVYVQLGVASL